MLCEICGSEVEIKNTEIWGECGVVIKFGCKNKKCNYKSEVVKIAKKIKKIKLERRENFHIKSVGILKLNSNNIMV